MNLNNESLKKIIVEEDPNTFNSSAAAPREQAISEALNLMQEKNHKYFYQSGVRAHKRGYGDFSPFYENATADYFFKCGYDNVSFVEAQQFLKDKIQQTLESNPVVAEVVNEYASKQIQK